MRPVKELFTGRRNKNIFRKELHMEKIFDCGSLVEIKTGHLKISEADCDIGFTNRYLTKDGKPWVPVMGEFHFSRYPNEEWETEILKIKAAGINIISTYLFWIHHEEKEGKFDFSGDRNIKSFLTLCQKHNMYVLLRIGPWCHGEAIYGGFPKFIQKRADKRSNSPKYLEKVEKIYTQYFLQSREFFYPKGCVIGIQLENEYGGRNKDHIQVLRALALKVGFKLPINTFTAWPIISGAKDNLLPMFGGYPERPWVQNDRPLETDGRFKIIDCKTDDGIGCDILKPSSTGEITYFDFPYATCELGCGNQVTEHRRPIISSSDALAMLIVTLAKGLNFPGYYMFHGGRNPYGGLYQESRKTLYPNNCPVISYDFQAPVSEYGFLRESYHRLKLVHYFLDCFGESFALTQSVFAEKNGDETDEKISVRISPEGSGYVFINNYQRLEPYKDINDLSVKILLGSKEINLPEICVKSGVSFFYPFNLKIGDASFDFITAQPVCKTTEKCREKYYFFSPDYVSCRFKTGEKVETQAKKEGETYILTDFSADVPAVKTENADIFILSEEQAQKLWYIDGNVLFSDGAVISNCGKLYAIKESSRTAPDIFLKPIHGRRVNYEHYLYSHGKKKTYELHIPAQAVNDFYECKIELDMKGNVAQCYCGGLLMADLFNYDGILTIGTRRFSEEIKKGLPVIIRVSPIDKRRRIYFEHPMEREIAELKIKDITCFDKTPLENI